MKKLKLKENEVVHCATLKQAKKVLKIANELGLTWVTKESYKDNYKFDFAKEKTCYYLNEGAQSSIDNVHKNYTIITSKEFIKRHKKTSLKKRIKALEDIVNGANESKNGWYKWKDTNYLMYHDFESHNKFGFGVNGEWYSKFKALGDLNSYTKKATLEEVEQRLIEEATKRGFNIDCQINCKNGQNFPAILNEFEYVEEENKLLYSGIEIMKNGEWENCKPYEKETTEETALRVFEEACKEVEQPKTGDVVKAWNDDKSKFVYGVYNDISPYNVAETFYRNIEKVTQISINDFKK